MNYEILMGYLRRAEDELANMREAIQAMKQGAESAPDTNRDWANTGASGS